MHEHTKRWLIVLISLVALKVLAAYAIKSTKTCATNAGGGTVLTSAMSTSLTPRRGWQVQNNGPNAIWCKGFNNAPSVGDGFKVAPGGNWPVDQTNSNGDTSAVITCIAETALQVSPACTNLQEGF